jgi:hypothetical protein
MLKILILKWLFNLSYANVIDHIKVNIAYQYFIGMISGFPDDHTVNDFNTLLSEHFVLDELFEMQLGIMMDEGMYKTDTIIIDSSMVEVGRPRNTKKEDEAIKDGKVPSEWEKESNRKKKAQKDMDARATFKHGRSYFGYKNRLAIDVESKLIVSSKTTPPSVYDSQICKD